MKSLKMNIQQPRLMQYMNKFKKEAPILEYPARKREKKETGEAYLGQRRRKEKGKLKTLGNQ